MDRRLGELLPHQLANPTRATPRADCSFPSQGVPGISGSFPPLSPAPGHIPTRYSPVRRSPCGALDLHVLGLPPAFVLSQDQTLRLIAEPDIHPTDGHPIPHQGSSKDRLLAFEASEPSPSPASSLPPAKANPAETHEQLSNPPKNQTPKPLPRLRHPTIQRTATTPPTHPFLT